MLKKTISYTDFNGQPQKEDLYFHLSETELIRMEVAQDEPLSDRLKRLTASAEPNKRELIAFFEDIIAGGYGEKSEDGKRFLKNSRITEDFKSTEAYNALFLNLLSEPGNAIEFIQGLIPSDLLAKIQARTGTEILSEEDQKRASEAARRASEAQMQGFKKKETPSVETVEDVQPAYSGLTEEEKEAKRRELGL